jgi:hypothetical protein
MLLGLKKLPYLPALLNKNRYSKTVGNSYDSDSLKEHLLEESIFLNAL